MRLGAWDVQGLPLEAGQPAPGPSGWQSPQPSHEPHARRPGTRRTDKQCEKIAGRGGEKQAN